MLEKERQEFNKETGQNLTTKDFIKILAKAIVMAFTMQFMNMWQYIKLMPTYIKVRYFTKSKPMDCNEEV